MWQPFLTLPALTLVRELAGPPTLVATRPSPLRTPEGDRLIPGASSSFLGHFHPPKPQEITAVRNRMSKPEGLGGQQEECELHMWDFLPRR